MFSEALYLKFIKIWHCSEGFLFLQNDKILDCSKFKSFADDKINVNEQLKFCLGGVENIMGKGENADYQHFLLFPQCSQKASLSRSFKVGIVW